MLSASSLELLPSFSNFSPNFNLSFLPKLNSNIIYFLKSFLFGLFSDYQNLADTMASYRPAGDVEYALPYSFPDEEERCEDPDQLRDQIARVRNSFDQAKAVMSRQAIAEIFEYLKQGEWIHDSKLASGHPAYARFMGKGKYEKSLYYPQFFAIQAIFIPDPKGRGILESVVNLYAEVSKHWGM